MKRKLVLIPSAYNHRAMGDIENFIPFYKDSMEVFVITDEEFAKGESFIDGVCYVNKTTSKAKYLINTADYIIDAGTITGNSKKNHSQKRISVWHGTPYKSMFADLGLEYLPAALDYDGGIDLMVSPSKWYTDHFLRGAMKYEGPVLETAISRTDSLYISEERKQEVRNIIGISENKKVALYAPTYRTRGDFALPFSVEKLKVALGPDWEIVTKLHYLNDLTDSEGVIDATEYPSINNLLSISDLLITDYSSLLFDYSILDKPALFFQYDREEYERDRKFMFALEDYVASEDIVVDEESFNKRISEIKEEANLKKIKENFYPHQKENATAELVRKLDLNTTPRKTREIIFLANDLNEIGGVHVFIKNLAREFKDRYDSKVMVLAKHEFNNSKDKAYVFDEGDLIDVKLSYESSPGAVENILSSTDGIIITCQFSIQKTFRKYIGDKRTILMFHGDTKDIVNRTLYGWHLDRLSDGSLEVFKRLVLLTKGNAELLKGSLNEEVKAKTIYIENGIDFSDAHNLYQESGEFVVASRLDEDKNPLEYIEIFSSPKLNEKYKLHIYGDGALRPEMEKLVAERGLQDRILFHGYENDKEVIFNGKQGVLSASLSEGFGLTLVEGIKYGIPVYAYDSYTACGDVVLDSVGVRIPTGDTEAFVDALNNAFDMATFNSEETINSFSSDKVSEKWKALFDELEDECSDAPVAVAKKQKKKKKSLRTRIRRKLGRYIRRLRKLVIGKSDRYPLVSVIVPFYNNHETVADTVKSIENNGYPNYEIILADDGSDRPADDSVIKRRKLTYIRHENCGPGLTRNKAMKIAKGKYVVFIDSDDVFAKDAIETMVNLAEKEDLSIVMGKARRVYVGTDKTEIWCKKLYKKTHVNEKARRCLIVDDTIASGKLYKLSALRDNGIEFEAGTFEDVLFMMEAYSKIDRVGLVNKHIMDWMVRGYGSSITRTPSIENVRNRITKFEKGLMYTNDILKVYYASQFVRLQIPLCVQGAIRYSDSEKQEMFKMLEHAAEVISPYVVEKMIVYPSKRLLYRSILAGDYDKFIEIAEGFSANYFKELESEVE